MKTMIKKSIHMQKQVKSRNRKRIDLQGRLVWEERYWDFCDNPQGYAIWRNGATVVGRLVCLQYAEAIWEEMIKKDEGNGWEVIDVSIDEPYMYEGNLHQADWQREYGEDVLCYDAKNFTFFFQGMTAPFYSSEDVTFQYFRTSQQFTSKEAALAKEFGDLDWHETFVTWPLAQLGS